MRAPSCKAALLAAAALTACAHRQPDPGLERARADMEREAYVEFVPAAAQEALGVPPQAVAATPFLDPADVGAPLPPQLGALEDALGACLPRGQAAWVLVPFGEDGRAGPPRVAQEGEGPEAAECLARAASSWQTGVRAPSPGVVFGVVLGSASGSAVAAAGPLAEDEPPARGPGVYRRPVGDAACVSRVVKAELARGGPVPDTTVELRFAVGKDGSVSRLRLLSRTPNRAAVAVAHAIQRCPWVPGTRDGTPIGMWLVWPVRVEK